MRLTSVAKAAEEIDLSKETINNMLKDGRLTRYKLKGGHTVRVDMDQLYGLFMPDDVEFNPEDVNPPKAEVPERRSGPMNSHERKRLETLDYIRDYTKTHGESPGLYAVSKRFGLTQAGASARLKMLEERGLIRRYTPINSKDVQYIVTNQEN